eukprot:301522-Chlamydomonas_euryale.AAC.12
MWPTTKARQWVTNSSIWTHNSQGGRSKGVGGIQKEPGGTFTGSRGGNSEWDGVDVRVVEGTSETEPQHRGANAMTPTRLYFLVLTNIRQGGRRQGPPPRICFCKLATREDGQRPSNLIS